MIYKLNIAEQTFKVDVGDVKDNIARVVVNGLPYSVRIDNSEAVGLTQQTAKPLTNEPVSVAQPKPASKAAASTSKTGAGVLSAPIPGLILQIKVNVGDKVTQGQIVAIMEAMKMENDLLSPISGTVKEIRLQKGSELSTGDVIMVIA
jgi:glutaconyl-CoA/methylmalonyl-CoA decarboxylase subunit gamma